METNSAELYIMPSFFSNFYSKEDNNVQQIIDIYDKGVFDQYTHIRQVTSEPISSQFKKIRYIPLSKGVLDYESDIWDFSQYTLISTNHTSLHFENVCENFKGLLKDHILLLILRGNIKLTSIYDEYAKLRPFLNFIYSKGVLEIVNIDESDISSFLSSLNVSSRTYIKYQHAIKNFLMLYDCENKTETLSPGIEKLCERMEFRKLKAEIISNRRSAIPDTYFNKLVQLLIERMEDSDEYDMIRAYCAMLLIDSQTGLRVSELSLLEANSVETMLIDDVNYRMIHYKIVKTAKGNTGYTEHITYINDLAYKGYKFLMDFFEENRKERNSNLLFCSKRGKLPIDTSMFVKYLRKLCVEYADVVGSTDSSYSDDLEGKTSLDSYIKEYRNKTIAFNAKENNKNLNLPKDTIFYYPLVHQFRNTVVDRLIRAGVKLEFIRRYMGHLSQEMTDSYASYKDTDLQENISFSTDVLKTYLTGETKILGNSGNSLMERIDEWIEEQNLTIEKDLDAIIDKLLKLVPIRSKHGGMCIKGAKLTDACSVDAMTDEFYCACGICPNVCHYYYHADVSYSDFKASKEIYEYNRKNGFNRQAEKEKKKVQFILNNRLIPELDELDRILDEHSKESVMALHPNMTYIVENLEEIRKDIKEWN